MLRTALTRASGGRPGARRAQPRRSCKRSPAGGFELGCHTPRHDFLPLLSAAELERVGRGGRDEIEAIAGRPARVLRLPERRLGRRCARTPSRAAGFAVRLHRASGGVVTPETRPVRAAAHPAAHGLRRRALARDRARAVWTRGAAPTMRIAMAGRYYNRQGGVSRCIAELSDRAALGDDVTVFAHEVLDRERLAGATSRMCRCCGGRPGCSRRHSPSRCDGAPRAEHFDVVHVHNPQGLGADVYTAHSCHAAYLDMRRAEGGARRLAQPRLSRRTSLELAFERYCYSVLARARDRAHARSSRRSSSAYVGIDPERIRVVPNGVDLEAFRPPRLARRGASRRWPRSPASCPRTPSLCCSRATSSSARDWRQVIEAMAAVGRAERLHLWVAGSADRGPYERLAERAGVAARVRFLGHQAQMAPLFQAADAFVFPTTLRAVRPRADRGARVRHPGDHVAPSRAWPAGWSDGAQGLLLERPERCA